MSEQNITGEVIPVRKLLAEHPKSYFSAPVYQRRYVWHKNDVILLIDDSIEAFDAEHQHFLGAIVRSEVRNKKRKMAEYLVVDGQQRLTTISLMLLVIAAQSTDSKLQTELLDLVSYEIGGQRLLRWTPTLLDTQQMSDILDDLETRSNVKVELDRKPSGSKDQALWVAYQTLWAAMEHTNKSTREKTAAGLLDKCVLATITIPKNVDPTQTFQSINGTGQQLQPGDLIRNFVFHRFGADQVKGEKFFREHWTPFEQPLQDNQAFEDFLYTFASCLYPDVTAKTVFHKLAKHWEKSSPITITSELLQYRDVFLAIATDKALAWEGRTPELTEAMMRIRRVDGAKNAWPYLLRLLHADLNGTAKSSKSVAKCIRLVETVFVRRALAGTGNHGTRYFFVRLFDNVGSDPKALQNAIKTERGGDFAGPTDADLEDRLLNNDFYNKKIAKVAQYVLETQERFAPMTAAKTYKKIDENFKTADHIMPQSTKHLKSWHVTKAVHAEYVHRIGNLMLIDRGTNSLKSAKSWAGKPPTSEGGRYYYSLAAVFSGPKLLAKAHATWGPEQITARTREILKFITLNPNGWKSF